MPACVILLSTYNGARFLDSFIASLLSQSEPDWLLLWRDDGSTDATVAIMEDWAQRLGHRCRRLTQPVGNLRVTGSFMALLKAAADAPAIAFADQDDVWLPDKLRWGLTALRAAPADQPALYCARQILADANLQRQGLSPELPTPGFPASLTQNIATGNTVMLNAAAIRLLAASEAPRETWHDWWCYLLVTAAGGQVIRDERGVILYRQHAGNTIGAAGKPLPRALAALKRGPGAFMTVLRAHVAALDRHAAQLTPDAQRDLAVIGRALRRSPVARLAALRLPGFDRGSRAQTALFRLWFLLG